MSTTRGRGKTSTVGRDLYERAKAAAPTLRGQLEALNQVARLTSHDPADRAAAQEQLFRDHGQAPP